MAARIETTIDAVLLTRLRREGERERERESRLDRDSLRLSRDIALSFVSRENSTLFSFEFDRNY